MPVRVGRSTALAAAVVALGTTWALAAAVQPNTHLFIKGEQFRYSDLVAVVPSVGKGMHAGGTPKPLSAVEEMNVVGVSATGVTLERRSQPVEPDQAMDAMKASFAVIRTSPTTITASRDGTWRYPDNTLAENVVTWDPVQLGAQPSALTVGQHWDLAIARTASAGASHAVVRVVSVNANTLTLHVEGTSDVSRIGSANRMTRSHADVVFDFGIVRQIHRVTVVRMDRGAGTPGVEYSIDRRIQLVSHMAP